MIPVNGIPVLESIYIIEMCYKYFFKHVLYTYKVSNRLKISLYTVAAHMILVSNEKAINIFKIGLKKIICFHGNRQ